MNREKVEILLIELAGASIRNKLAWRHSIFRSAPIGLYCLKQINKDKIDVIDVPVAQIVDNLNTYKNNKIKYIICRLPEDPNIEEINTILASIHNIFKTSAIGCNSTDSNIIDKFDFVIKGTGKTALTNILNGSKLSGLCDHIKEDSESNLNIPQEPLIDVGYSILCEKWLSEHNLEIWQPWQGLDEFSSNHFTYPGLDWLNNLLNWLRKSGYDSFHFNPSNWTADEVNALRSTINNLKINLSLSFNYNNPIKYSDILLPLKRLWIYYPNPREYEEVIKNLKGIKSAGFEACMQVNHSWFACGSTLPVCKYIDKLVIIDDYMWSNIELKKFIQRFWGSRNRFFKQLLNLRSASELVAFLKSSYALLEILFLPDNKGEQK